MNTYTKSLFFIVFFIFLLCLISSEQSYALEIGGDFPSFYLKTIDGDDFFLNEYVGPKATKSLNGIIFSFCASYCKPCKREIPELEKLKNRFTKMGIGIFIVAIEKEELARTILEETGTTIPMLLDRYLVTQKLIGFTGIPFTVMIDSDQKIRYIGTAFPEGKEAETMKRLDDAAMDMLDVDSGGTAGR